MPPPLLDECFTVDLEKVIPPVAPVFRVTRFVASRKIPKHFGHASGRLQPSRGHFYEKQQVRDGGALWKKAGRDCLRAAGKEIWTLPGGQPHPRFREWGRVRWGLLAGVDSELNDAVRV